MGLSNSKITEHKLERRLFNSKLEELNSKAKIALFNSCGIHDNHVVKLSKKLKKCKSLAELDLNGNEIKDVSKLILPSSLTKLFIDYNQLHDVSSLILPSSLTILNLTNNKISDVSKLILPSCLLWLSLDYNQIRDVSKLILPSSLTWLSLNHNEISDVSQLILSPSLASLYLGYNQIREVSKLILPSSLFTLDLQNNQLQIIYPTICFLLNLEILFYVNPLIPSEVQKLKYFLKLERRRLIKIQLLIATAKEFSISALKKFPTDLSKCISPFLLGNLEVKE